MTALALRKAARLSTSIKTISTMWGVFTVPKSGGWFIVVTGNKVEGWVERAASTDVYGAEELARCFKGSRIIDARTGGEVAAYSRW
jgi:hypothetical protein